MNICTHTTPMCTATLLTNYSVSLIASHFYVVPPFCEMSLFQNLTLAINLTLTMFWLALTITLLFHIQTDKLLVSGNLSHLVWLGVRTQWFEYFSPSPNSGLQTHDLDASQTVSVFRRHSIYLWVVTQLRLDSGWAIYSQTDIFGVFWVLSLILCVYICLLSQTFWVCS